MILLAFAENSIQLVPDGTLFFHIALILLMVYVLNKTLFRPINHILEERERRTRGRSAEAQDVLRRVDENVTRYERALREARTAGYQLLEALRGEAMRLRQERINAARDEVNRLVEEQKRLLRMQSEEARRVLDNEARDVAEKVGAQILGRSVGGTSRPSPPVQL